MARRLAAGRASRGVLIGVVLACASAAASSKALADTAPPQPPPAPQRESEAVTRVSERSNVSLAPPQVGPGRLVVLGDSIADQLCSEFRAAVCVAFPGGWVADVNGTNLADEFVTEAALRPNDTVVMSSIGGWHSPGVDDAEIMRRLDALYQRVSSSVRRLVVLVPPSPNFGICVHPSTPEAIALLGSRHDEVCHTQQLIADLERTWPVTEVPIIGPYVADEEHETPEARHTLALAIRFVLATNPHEHCN